MKNEKLLREYIRKVIIRQLHEVAPVIAIAARAGLQMVGKKLAKQAVKQTAKQAIKKMAKGQVKGKAKDYVVKKLKNQKRELNTSLYKSSQMSSLQNRENEIRKKIADLKN